MEATTTLQELVAAGNNLQRLVRSVDDAPFEVLSLSNNVANLNLIISSSQRQGLSQDQNVLLSGIFKSYGLQIRTLRDLAEEMCRVYGGGDFRSKRRKWVRHRVSVTAILQEMRYLRISIAAAMSTVILSIIKSSELKLDRIITSEFEPIKPRTSITMTKWRCTHPDWYQRPHDGMADLAATLRQDISCFGLVFSVCQITPCFARCNCLCHEWEADTPIPFLNSLLGALLSSYCKSPLNYTKCSTPTCGRTHTVINEAVYYFPPKAIPTMISIVQWMISQGNPTAGLMATRVVSQDSEEILLTINGDIKGLQTLISGRRVDLRSVVSVWGDTPLSIAVSNANVEMARFLLGEGLDPFLKDAHRVTSNDIVWTKVLGNTIDTKSAEAFKVLFEDYFAADEMGFTILHQIVLNLSFQDLRSELQAKSTPINAQDDQGTTALSWAALRGDFSRLTLLLEFGADPNIGCNDGQTPLHNAVTHLESINCVLALLDAGADVKAQNARGYTALHFAAAYQAPREYIELLLTRGCNLNHRAKDGITALKVATRRNDAILKFLLDSGADPDIGSFEDESTTPLVIAVQYNRHAALKTLLGYGVDYGLVSRKGDTIVHRAAEWADEETFDILRAAAGLRGLDPMARNLEGLTPMMVFGRRVVILEELSASFESFLDSVEEGRQGDLLGIYDAMESWQESTVL